MIDFIIASISLLWNIWTLLIDGAYPGLSLYPATSPKAKQEARVKTNALFSLILYAWPCCI